MKCGTFALVFLMAFSAFGQGAYYASFKIGLGDTTGNDAVDTDPELTYGGNGGVLLNSNITLGLNVNYYAAKFTSSEAGGEVEYSLLPILADVAFFLSNPAEGHGLYIGGLMGVTRSSLKTPVDGTVNSTDFTFGGKVGVLFNVAQNFSIAPEFNVIHVFADNDDIQLWEGQIVLTRWF